MKQYLLAVHAAEATPPEQAEQAYQDVNAFNAELQEQGAWVFAGGLYPPDTVSG
jgi:hypothetical protein